MTTVVAWCEVDCRSMHVNMGPGCHCPWLADRCELYVLSRYVRLAGCSRKGATQAIACCHSPSPTISNIPYTCKLFDRLWNVFVGVRTPQRAGACTPNEDAHGQGKVLCLPMDNTVRKIDLRITSVLISVPTSIIIHRCDWLSRLVNRCGLIENHQ